MSNIVFTFDAEAAGILAAVNGMVDGFQTLVDAAEGVTTGFMNIASQTSTLMSSWGVLLNNFTSFGASLSQATTGMDGASTSAQNLTYQLQRMGDESAQAAVKHSEAVQRIQEQEENLTDTTQREIDTRTLEYQQSIDRMVVQHQRAIQSIQDQEQQLTENFQDQMDKRLVQLQNPRALMHQQMTTQLEEQISGAVTVGDTTRATALATQLDTENAAYQTFLTNTIQPWYKELDQKGYDRYTLEQQRSQQRLADENSQYAQQQGDTQNRYTLELADLESHYADELKALQNHLADENQAYAYQMQQLALQRQHLLDTGGGSGGTNTVGNVPAAADGISVLKLFGLNPDDPMAKSILLKWLVGGTVTANGITKTFPQGGQAYNSQLNIPQLEALMAQMFSFGQDPTKQMGRAPNMIVAFSDLVARSAASKATTGMNQNQIANSWEQVLEKAMTGNTYGMTRQLLNLGVDPQSLAQYGVKMKGKQFDPSTTQNLMYALAQYSQATAGGLGTQQAATTPSGITNRFKDFATSTVLGVIGNNKNPVQWVTDLMTQLNRLLDWLYGHQAALVGFGKSITQWVLGKVKDFVDWLDSSNGKKTLHDIADAFHAIGDALHWMDQHKDIIALIMGLLLAQAGSKILGGLSLNPVKQFMNGGLLGAGGTTGGGLFGFLPKWIGGNYAAGKIATADAQLVNPLIRGAGGVENALAQAGGGIPFMSGFESLAQHLGISKGGARLAGLTADPFGALKMMGMDGLTNFMRTGGNVVGMGQGAVQGTMGIAGKIGTQLAGTAGIFSGAGGGVSGITAVLGQGLGALGPMVAGILPALGGIAAAAGPILLVAAAIGGLIFLLVQNKEKIKPFIDMLTKFFGEQLKQAQKAIGDFVGQVQDRLGPAFGPGSFVYKTLQVFSLFWAGAWGGIQLVFKGVWDIISGIFKFAWAIISNLVLAILDLLSGKPGKAMEDLGNMFKGAWNAILQIFGGVFKIIGGLIWGFFGGLWNMVAKPLTGFWNGLVGFFTGIPGAIGGWLGGMGKAIGDAFSALTNLPHTVFALILQKAGPLHDPLQALAHTVGIPGYASGGAYPGGQLSLVGERGPELFYSNRSGSILNNDVTQSLLMRLAGGPRMVFTGDIHVHGVQDPDRFYTVLNRKAGFRNENGARGSRL